MNASSSPSECDTTAAADRENTPYRRCLAAGTLAAMKLVTSIAILATFTLTSCTSGPNARTGTVIGALGGAAAGGIIGNQSGRGLEGAAIGAGLGGLGGNMIGGAQDQRNGQYQDRRYDRRRY